MSNEAKVNVDHPRRPVSETENNTAASRRVLIGLTCRPHCFVYAFNRQMARDVNQDRKPVDPLFATGSEDSAQLFSEYQAAKRERFPELRRADVQQDEGGPRVLEFSGSCQPDPSQTCKPRELVPT